MPDIRQISAWQSERASERSLCRQLQAQRIREQPAIYQGYDADLGMHLAQELGEEAIANFRSLTNAGLEPGDPIEVRGDRLDAMPRVRVVPQDEPVLDSQQAFATAMLTGVVFTPSGGSPAGAPYFWLKGDRDAIATQYPLAPYITLPNGFYFLSGQPILTELTRSVVQIFPTISISGFRLNESATFFAQPYGLQSGRYYEEHPSDLTNRIVDLVTIDIQGGAIVRVEGTLSRAAEPEGPLRFKTQYSDYWSDSLDFLPGTEDYVYRNEVENQTISYSSLGRFTFDTPALERFIALENFFGVEPIAYSLSGEEFRFPVTVEELGLSQLSTSVDFVSRSQSFAEYITTLDGFGRFKNAADFIQGDPLGEYIRTWLQVSGVRGGVI